MLAWGWHPTLALYWLKCIMPMLATDVKQIFHQRWLNRNKKKSIFGKLDVKKFEETNYYNNYGFCKDVGKTLAILAKHHYIGKAILAKQYWQSWDSIVTNQITNYSANMQDRANVGHQLAALKKRRKIFQRFANVANVLPTSLQKP